MSKAAITSLSVTAGYIAFNLVQESASERVVIKQDVVEEHALRHPMNDSEIRNYIAANLDTFVDAVQRIETPTANAKYAILIDKMDQLEPKSSN